MLVIPGRIQTRLMFHNVRSSLACATGAEVSARVCVQAFSRGVLIDKLLMGQKESKAVKEVKGD